LAVCFADDPHTRRRVIAPSVAQLHDDHTLTVEWLGSSPFAAPLTDAVPMAMALGVDPATLIAVGAVFPDTVDRLLLAGWLRRDHVAMVRAKTVPLEVPARAEIVLEGYLTPADPRPHGPAADDTGSYQPPTPRPTFVVTTMTHRRNPILPAMVVGRPPAEAHWLAKAGERLALPVLQLALPEIVDLNSPIAVGTGRLTLVRLRKRYPGHARQVIAALFGHPLTARAKVIIVVDAETDVQNLPETLARWLSATDVRRDAVIFDGPLPPDDYAAPALGYGGKIGFDATAKLPEEASRPWPTPAPMLPIIQHRIDEIWAALKL
ncbi:MAG: UbiD family decarboxylase, partial [Dehalococcoidia bacterium]|nr:UbiD family decarboxylase [Dehalococcoidia bacterium]